MNEVINVDTIRSQKSPKKYISGMLTHSNSDTNFELLRIKHPHKKNFNTEHSSIEAYIKERSYIQPHSRLNNMLRKDKKRLKDFIIDNPKYVKLYGNKRYKNDPNLFVMDQKKNITDKQTGLLPVPFKKKKKVKTSYENYKIYDLQRSVVMMRRFQYNYGISCTNSKPFNLNDLSRLQKWWKLIHKVLKIQKCFRGYRIRKQTNALVNLIYFMKNFENFLLKLQCKNALLKIKNIDFYKKKISSCCYFLKECLFVSNQFKSDVVQIQKNFRKFIQVKKKYKLLENNLKCHACINLYFATKKIYNPHKAEIIINNLSKNIKQFLLYNKRKTIPIIKTCSIIKEIKIIPNLSANKIEKLFKKYHTFVTKDKMHQKNILKNPTLPFNFISKFSINQNSLKNYLKNYHNNKVQEEDLAQCIYVYTKNPCFISKCRYNDLIYNIKLLQKNIKKMITKKNINKKYYHNGYYISKTYVKNFVNKLIDFNKKIKHAKLISLFRKKTYPVLPLKEFGEIYNDDIIKIQRNYKAHFQNNKKNFINIPVINSPFYISKKRLINNMSNVNYLEEKLKDRYFKKREDKNKQNVVTKPNLQKIGLITKKNFINNEKEIIEIQKIFKGYNERKIITQQLKDLELKKKESTKEILKNNFKSFISKRIIKTKNLAQIKTLQSYFKKKLNENKEINNEMNKNNNYYYMNKKSNHYIKKPKSDIYCYITKNIFLSDFGCTYKFAYKNPQKITVKNHCYIDKVIYKNVSSSINKIQSNYKDLLKTKKNIKKKDIIAYPNSSNNDDSNSIEKFDKNITNCYYISKYIKRDYTNQIILIQNKLHYMHNNNENNSNNFNIIKGKIINKKLLSNSSLNGFYISKIRTNSNIRDKVIKKLKLKKVPIFEVSYFSKIRLYKKLLNSIILLQQKYRSHLNNKLKESNDNDILNSINNLKNNNYSNIQSNNNYSSNNNSNVNCTNNSNNNNFNNNIIDLKNKNNSSNSNINSNNQNMDDEPAIKEEEESIMKDLSYKISEDYGYIDKIYKLNTESKIIKLQKFMKKQIKEILKNKNKIIPKKNINSLCYESKKHINALCIESKNNKVCISPSITKVVEKAALSRNYNITKQIYNNIKLNEKKIGTIQKHIKKFLNKKSNNESKFIENDNEDKFNKTNKLNKVKKINEIENDILEVEGLSFYFISLKGNTRPLIKTWSFCTKKIIKKISKDLSFLKLLFLLPVKNCQELVFNKLKFDIFPNKTKKLQFYYHTIQRAIKFLKYGNPENKALQAINTLNKILKINKDDDSDEKKYNDENKENEAENKENEAENKNEDLDGEEEKVNENKDEKKSNKDKDEEENSNQSPEPISKTISNLSPTQLKELNDTNLFSDLNDNTVEFLNEFSDYDKGLANKKFISERLKDSKLPNTNVFSLFKFLDNEYDKLIKGKYCFKCFKDIDECKCTLISHRDNFTSNDDFEMDLDEDSTKRSIHHFEYDLTKTIGVLMKANQKTTEPIEEPIIKISTKNYIDNNNNINNNNKSFNNCNNNDLNKDEDDYNRIINNGVAQNNSINQNLSNSNIDDTSKRNSNYSQLLPKVNNIKSKNFLNNNTDNLLSTKQKSPQYHSNKEKNNIKNKSKNKIKNMDKENIDALKSDYAKFKERKKEISKFKNLLRQSRKSEDINNKNQIYIRDDDGDHDMNF